MLRVRHGSRCCCCRCSRSGRGARRLQNVVGVVVVIVVGSRRNAKVSDVCHASFAVRNQGVHEVDLTTIDLTDDTKPVTLKLVGLSSIVTSSNDGMNCTLSDACDN